VKNELVDTYGFKLVVSGFGSSTLKVQQLPSIFSTLNTVEQVSDVVPFSQVVVLSLSIGILHAAPFPQQV
jgi:hypothetical protein